MKRERTPEERERARLEREAKRAAREGRPPPEAVPPTEVPPPDLYGGEPASEVSKVRLEEPLPPPEPDPEPPPPLPESDPEPPPLPEPEPDPEPLSPPPEPEPEPDPEPLPPPPEPEPDPEPSPMEDEEPPPRGEDEESPPWAEDEESPPWAEPEVTAAPEPEALPAQAEPPPPRRPVAPPPFAATGTPSGSGIAARSATARQILDRRRAREAAAGRTPGNRRRLRLIPVAAAVVVLLAAGWLLVSLYQPFAGDGEGLVRVEVASGSSVGEIAEQLEREGVISNAFFFRARATVSGNTGEFKAGKFDLKEGMSYAAAIEALSTSPALDTVTVTIPEGLSRREAKDVIAQSLDGDYLALTKRSPLLSPGRFGAKGAEDLEGFLFPATYELKRGKGARELVRQQLAAFREQFAGVDMSFAKSRNRSRYDVLVIASMIEREAQVAKERPLVASVIYNRLDKGIPLGIDATTRFAVNNYTEPLKESELASDSPYNTRERQGLPPGPIGSPGLAAIRAAARPARSDFLFYVVKPNTCGEHDFSRTGAEFEEDVARYNKEREARGGKSPTNC